MPIAICRRLSRSTGITLVVSILFFATVALADSASSSASSSTTSPTFLSNDHIKADIGYIAPEFLQSHPWVAKWIDRASPVLRMVYKFVWKWTYAVYVQPWARTLAVVKAVLLLPWSREKFTPTHVMNHAFHWLSRLVPAVIAVLVCVVVAWVVLSQGVSKSPASYDTSGKTRIEPRNEPGNELRNEPGNEAPGQFRDVRESSNLPMQ